MPVQYRHNYFELYSLSGGQTLADNELRGISVNKYHPTEYKARRDFSLYTFNADGTLSSIKQYDLLGDVFGTGTTAESDRMVADLDAMPLGQLFVIFTYDEPQGGHDNVDLLNAMYAFTVVNNVIIPLPDLWTWGDFIIVP